MDTEVPGTCQRKTQDRIQQEPAFVTQGGSQWAGQRLGRQVGAGRLRQGTRGQVEGSQGRSGWLCPCPRGAPGLESHQAGRQQKGLLHGHLGTSASPRPSRHDQGQAPAGG